MAFSGIGLSVSSWVLLMLRTFLPLLSVISLFRGNRLSEEFLVGGSQRYNFLSGHFQVLRESLNALIAQLIICIFNYTIYRSAFINSSGARWEFGLHN